MPESIAVSVKNVSKQFDNVEVLRDINLTVEKGTVVSMNSAAGRCRTASWPKSASGWGWSFRVLTCGRT